MIGKKIKVNDYKFTYGQETVVVNLYGAFKNIKNGNKYAIYSYDNNNDKLYVCNKGMDKIIEHAYDIIDKRLAPEEILNDGKQTPMRGHPVFKAQHATATCCRGCLEKWHKIPKGIELTDNQVNYVVALIMEWIKRKY